MVFDLAKAKYTRDIFMNEYLGYSIEKFTINDYRTVFIVEDVLVLYVELDITCKYSFEQSEEYTNEGACCLIIEEITYNSIKPNYNYTAFITELEKYDIGAYPSVVYIRFKGFDVLPSYTSLYDGKTTAQHLSDDFPELKIRERFDSWVGIDYHYIILRMLGADNKYGYLVLITKKNIQGKILSFCNLLLNNSSSHFLYETFPSNQIVKCGDNFIKAFSSWKHKNKKKRLDEHLEYIVIDKVIKEEHLVLKIATKILGEIDLHIYSNLGWNTYTLPVYKWKSEEFCLKLIKKLYREYNVIYQHRPFYLQSSFGGQMSYDIFIAGLNIAIEYQGKQHFEPIEYFGGKEAFDKLKIRDKEKKELSEIHNVKLIYVNYWEDITENLLKEKVTNCIRSSLVMGTNIAQDGTIKS